MQHTIFTQTNVNAEETGSGNISETSDPPCGEDDGLHETEPIQKEKGEENAKEKKTEKEIDDWIWWNF